MHDLRTALLIPLLLVACGPDAIGDDEVGDGSTDASETETSETDASETDTGTSNADASETDTTTGEPAIECEQACAVLVEGSCYTTQTCLDTCMQGFGAWTPALAEAFAGCMAQNPLCFESIEGCMLAALYPAGTEHLARVSGSGFAEQDGATVYIWDDPDVAPDVASEATIVAGEFAFEWSAAWPVFDGGGPLFLLYIDVDGDALCEPGVDVTASVITQWNGSFDAPVFEAELVAPANPSDFVCSSLP